MSIRKRVQNFLRDPNWTSEQEQKFVDREKVLKFREEKVSEKETGLYRSETWANLVIGDYNPDKISLETYKKMVDFDSQVRKGLDILEMGVLYVPWEIKHSNQEIKDFVTWSLKRMRHPTFEEALREIMSAIPYGFSVTESVWEYVEGKKKWSVRKDLGLKTFDPENITFFSDPMSHLKKVELKADAETIPLPMDRLIVYSYNKKFGNWYGESILRACYKNWFIKDNMLKFANIAFERFGAPIMLGISKDITSKAEVLGVLEHLFARSVGVVVKKGEEDPTDIKVLESRRASMPFMDYINYHDRMILERMLIGETLLKGGGGVYGPKMPYEILNHRLQEIRRGVSGALSDLLDMLVNLNFDTDEPAELVFGPIPEIKIQEEVEKAMSERIGYDDLRGRLQ